MDNGGRYLGCYAGPLAATVVVVVVVVIVVAVGVDEPTTKEIK